MSLRPAVFLDRDGTLNQQVVREGKPYPPASLEEFRLFPGAAESCARLKAAGFALVIVTNQPDVARGTQRRGIIEAMHALLMQLIPEIDRIEVCYAPGRGIPDPDDYRRKPATGMLTDAARALGLDLTRSWMVGDRAGDIGAGHTAGCRTVFIDWGYTEPLAKTPPDFTAKSIVEAVKIIIANQRQVDFE
jgi:D-glycero-D-manno-heptose 1,7-bisphosphate phosphatase